PISRRFRLTSSSSRARRLALSVAGTRGPSVPEVAATAGAPVHQHDGRGGRGADPSRRPLGAPVTPYPEALTGPIRAALEANGLGVPLVGGLGLTDSLEIPAVPPAAITHFAVDTFRRGPADAVFVACCTFRAFDARDAIAAALD